MSTLARRVPVPSSATTAATCALSTVVYESEQRAQSTPLFTLFQCGKERSALNLHFPMLCPFGISPNLSIWRGGRPWSEWKGPNNLPQESSSRR